MKQGISNFQFHSTQEEIIELIKTSINTFDLWVISIRLFPTFEYEVISKNQFYDKSSLINSSRMIFLLVSEPHTITNDYMRFLDENKNSLVIQMGENNERILRESSIGSITDDIGILKIWKSILKGFKKKMLKGAWIMNPHTGKKNFYKNHYYTHTAQKKFRNGCQITPITGWAMYYLTHEI